MAIPVEVISKDDKKFQIVSIKALLKNPFIIYIITSRHYDVIVKKVLYGLFYELEDSLVVYGLSSTFMTKKSISKNYFKVGQKLKRK